VDSLRAWTQASGLGGQKMVLVGHSLGGYLSACFALRHPELVQVCRYRHWALAM
jgi:abhydrolase domain-containing protein 5